MFLMWIPGCSSLIFQLLQDGHIRNEDNSAWRPRYSTDNYQWEVGRSNTSHRVIFLISWHPPPSITNPFSTNLPTREHFQCHSTKYLWIWGPSRPRVAAAAERTVAEDKGDLRQAGWGRVGGQVMVKMVSSDGVGIWDNGKQLGHSFGAL